MAKVMVSLPDELLEAVDQEAARRGTTRSGLLRTFAEHALEDRSSRRADRMAELDRDGASRSGHGGNVADLVKTMRP